MGTAVLGSKHKDDLTLLLSEGEQELGKLAAFLKSNERYLISPDELEKFISPYFEGTKLARPALSNIVLYSTEIDRGALSEEDIRSEVISELSISVDKQKVLDDLIYISSSAPMSAAIKMANLAYDLPSIVDDLKLISDLRPVFSTDRSEVVAYVIMNNLHFIVRDKYGTKTHAHALSLNDIKKLKICCEQAIEKVKFLEDQVTNTIGVPVYIPGESGEEVD
jgi:hypothetical protein